MENLDDSETAKVSDSAYSNSCSNSQSRRSHSSKSTHSGSHSSGSSGYGGKPSTSGGSTNLGQPPKKEKELKKMKQPSIESVADVVVEAKARSPEPTPAFDTPEEEQLDVIPTPSPAHPQAEKGVENMDICSPELGSLKEEVISCNVPQVWSAANFVNDSTNNTQNTLYCSDGFSCVISMHDGVVMYTTSSLTTTLGFPKDMWIGRSFIDFVHQKDRSILASQITSGLAIPKVANGTQEKAQSPPGSVSTMLCRIRRYRNLSSGFSVKDKAVVYVPFLLKLTFKNINDEEGKVIYLVVQATPFYSAFKTPNEIISKPIPFVIRHAANGHIEYVEPESVPYLGYLPQDLADKDALQLYHPDDLHYLHTVYDTIVKEGGLPRSKSFRMMTNNGDYIKLETEWSSFINPWSKKLEFVIGKHYIIEGPSNPDVFDSPDPNKKVPEEENKKSQKLRENIIRTMNEVLTKPAEIARQQMSKRCQDLVTFMESLMEEAPKTEEELRLEIQDPDHSYYERDSVMLGGISPHHDYYDSKSSTETPLSYTQLNYNETLQRYFESHQPISYEDYNTVTGENVLELRNEGPVTKHCLSPTAQTGCSGEMTCSSDSVCIVGERSPKAIMGSFQPIPLTEGLLNRHNSEMEKELMKMHRVTRSSSKGERKKNSNATRQKKKEHLARCNASFHPTTAGAATTEQQPHGVKRASKQQDSDTNANKHHCPSVRHARRRQRTSSTSAAVAQSSANATIVANQWPTDPVNNMNAFLVGVGLPQQMPMVNHMPAMVAMPGMYSMYYTPATLMQTTSTNTNPSTSHQFQAPTMMMYGQPMYGSPLMYSAVNHMQPTQMIAQQSLQYTNTVHPLGLTSSNYEEACKSSITSNPGKSSGVWRDKIRDESSNTDQWSADNNTRSSKNALQRSTEAATNTFSIPPSRDSGVNKSRQGQSDETPDKTDGESSYSSFYSSFFKTESGSAEESIEAKHGKNKRFKSPLATTGHSEPPSAKNIAKRKVEPPWMEQVCVTSELIYKYQILTKNMEEVLTADKQKMKTLEQPSLVNEQLGQLYLDLQLEGVAARLSLEEGITSSSSSGEENCNVSPETTPGLDEGTSPKKQGKKTKGTRRKREYSKLVMIYEEDAPLPSPPEGEAEEDSNTPTF